jgi:hypothetical protein
VHHVQAEADLVTTTLVPALEAFHREKLTLRQRHVAVARQVGDYNFNNTYQNVVNRDDVHLSWIEAALLDLGGTVQSVDEPSLRALGRKESFLPFVRQDAEDIEAFVGRWRPRLSEIGNARHRNMMSVILGETLEQKRFFDQMAAGRQDLLGRRSNGAGSPGTGDGVLPVRWIE